jgi:hypothetical protein
MNLRLIAGWVGPALGLAGGLVGVYCSYRAARGPRERRFVIWASLAILAFILSFLVALFSVPRARVWILTTYIILLPLGIRYLNRKQNAIRRREQADA